MPDHHDLVALCDQLAHFDVYLGHQRAGRIKHMQVASRGFGSYCLRYAVSTENQHRVRRNLLK